MKIFNVILFFCNVAVLIIIIGLNDKLETHNKILLSPDLQNQIKEICHDAAKKTMAVTEKELFTRGINTDKQLTAIKTQVEAIEKSSNAVVKTLAELQKERSTKAGLYLKAARASKETPETAQILYMSALAHSDDKAEPLSEFIDWQTNLLKKDLEKKELGVAQERLATLAGICDANIALGSVNDMKSIPELKNKLIAAEKLIIGSKERLVEDQKKEITSIEQRIDNAKSYSNTEKLLRELTDLTVDASLSDRKDALAAKIILKQSCLTTPSDQLIIPTISDATPWTEWLKNFTVRLKSNLPIAKKLEDIGTAAEFLQAAKASDAKGVQDLITEIEKVSRGIYLSYWKERVERITSSSDSNLNDVSTLMTESNSFSVEEQKENKIQIVKLNKCITKATLVEFAEGLKNLKALENSLADETYMQMIASTQGQYIQLLLRLKDLDTKFANQFSAEISDVTQKIAFLGQLVNAYKNKLLASELKKQNDQRERFDEWAKKQLKKAEKKYEDGKLAGRKHGLDDVINAWFDLMIVHPGDLQVVAPALYLQYDDLKRKIENFWTPTQKALSKVKYKRISDF